MDKLLFIERLKTFREHKKLTASKMAEIFGVTSSAYRMYETAKRKLPAEYMFILFTIGCNLNWLISGEGSMELNDEIVESESEIIKSLVKSNEYSAKAVEHCSGATLSATKTAENLSELLATQINGK